MIAAPAAVAVVAAIAVARAVAAAATATATATATTSAAPSAATAAAAATATLAAIACERLVEVVVAAGVELVAHLLLLFFVRVLVGRPPVGALQQMFFFRIGPKHEEVVGSAEPRV